ncbi:uncharacterized protein LOC103717295 [Phoenix dactylifera]|uniref:Uncharacterized protein LOC103717295 n=1 Tax=Phoenix dactylifera TaxID=42345 RepID=A0A8B7CPX2_PHODC|nr:uncharacterized protein LOC103717295 [Phoenix dactylifera]
MGIVNPGPLDLMLFYKMERDFYDRLVRELGQVRESIELVMAMWLWFESLGHHDFIRHVAAYQDDVILRFIAEGEACLDRLMRNRDSRRSEELPFTSSLMAEPIDLRFFEYHRDIAFDGVRHFLENVCRIIFDDAPMERVARDSSHPDHRRVLSSGLHVRRLSAEACTEEEVEAMSDMAPATPPSSRSALNPMARPWSPETDHTPEEQRSMFITFSKGYPISREDISDFFKTRYGPCVETVMIEKAPASNQPLYGRLVFTSIAMIAVVLNGQQTAKFRIKGKHLWARMYLPRRN